MNPRQVQFLLLAALQICFVAAQEVGVSFQPAPTSTLSVPVTQKPTCNVTTTKPTTEVEKYVFKSCIVAQFSTYITVGPGKYVELTNGTVNQNVSKCEDEKAKVDPQLMVEFDCGSISLTFSHTNDSKTYVKSMNGKFTFNGTGLTTFSNNTPAFYTTQSGHYYKCNSEQSIPGGNNLTLYFSNLAFEVFRASTGTDFYQIPEECLLDSQPVSDVVRIGVGICLIALVAVVLIAYFIGRRRWSERSTYESV